MNEYELEEIKREIVESRSLSIKTNNLVNALAADIKSIAKRQQGTERRALFNSATAYVVTIGVILLFVKLAWDLRLDAVRSETQDARDRVTQLEKDIKQVQAREEARTRASRQAAEFYELVAQNKRREVIDGHAQIEKLDLSPTERALFGVAAERARNELSLLAYQAGLDHARAGRWHEAQEQFRESLKLKNDAAHSPAASYQLSRALVSLGNHRDAIPILMQLSEASSDKEVMDEATFLLAQAQLDIQAWNDAKNTMRAFLRRFPASPHANEVKTKLAEVQLYH
ncbi:MAG TPA: tetratricopeptide repeat protein [Polyangiaceae bacterium]|jgi:TolA-binding protein|nr:tetratricopeptide repeat protein [Polyangiaceae bacterium]